MNNSFIAIENVSLELEPSLDNTVHFRQRESELIAIIETINKIAESKEWKVLNDKIFNGVVEGLKRERESEIEKQPLNGPKIHNLNGQIKWARKYTNFTTLADIYKQELINVRKQLNGKD